MKKNFNRIIVVMLSVFIIMSPLIVKADLLQLHSNAYSKYVSVDSEFIYAIEVGNNSFDGIVTFDSNILEVVNIETVYSGSNDVYGGNQGTVTKNVNNNQLSINYVTGDFEENILVTFKVKSYPSSGTTTVKVKANNNMWFGEPSNTMNIVKGKECPTCENDETSCPVCDECEKCGTNNELVTENNHKNNNVSANSDNNTLLYVSLGVCGILAVAVVILAVRKK